MASSKFLISRFVANCSFSGVRFFLFFLITPLLSSIIKFLMLAPKDKYNLEQEIAAAPAPETTIFTSCIFLFASSMAFINAAADIIAVPC